MRQSTNSILMIRPNNFGFNEETANDNHYQNKEFFESNSNENAQKEFDNMVKNLKQNGISVHVFQDDDINYTPDSIFPNNWISFHENGDIGLYPMYAKNRRLERRPEVLEFLEERGFGIENIVDYSGAESENKFLEGTGSMILDRENRIAYCSISNRSNEDLFIDFCEDFEFTPVLFNSYQSVGDERLPIYHTNVMMCVTMSYVVICLDAIDDKKQRKNVSEFIKKSEKELINISENQVEKFAGNMLELLNDKGESVLVMSKSAENSLSENQKNTITNYSKIISSDINTIELCGGGSARCMMAEIFLPKK
ncbi:MAG: citrulline utilization hydrolase CtlX [Flavobacteriaceae bacterium]